MTTVFLIRRRVPPLVPLRVRPAAEILSDIDQQVGRLARLRESAAELIARVGEAGDDRTER